MIIEGSALKKLRDLEPVSVQACITSPPYFNLRDYGTGTWEAGRDPGCDHVMGRSSNRNTAFNERWGFKAGDRKQEISTVRLYGKVCGRCGAVRVDEQLGMEDTPEEYVEKLADILDEVHRVLRDDGTLWLNLGDSYADRADRRSTGETFRADRADVMPGRANTLTNGRKVKDLIGIPWAVAFELRARGWYLRSEIVWHKPNALPESVEDRPTSSHEKLFLLTKQESYFYDHEAIREPDMGHDNNYRQVLSGQPSLHPPGSKHPHSGLRTVNGRNGQGRNKRNVWRIPTQPFPGAHFAVMPTRLVEPCLLAGTAAGDVVLDPFAGSGTVGVVCAWHSREFIGIELNAEFCEMARNRILAEGRPGARHVPDDPIVGQLALEVP